MKKLIISSGLIFMCLLSFGQNKKDTTIKISGDTLEIVNFRIINYIKIGNNIYQIKSPTLELLPKDIFSGLKSGSITFPDFRYTVPALSNSLYNN